MSKTFVDILKEEKSEDKIFIDGHNQLWFSWSLNSGQTIQLNKLKSYITDSKNDSNYDKYNVDNFLKYSKKPIKTKGYQSLYSIPIYIGKEQANYDIFNGDENPKQNLFYIISKQKNVVITFFKTKKEAESWIKSTK